MMEVLQFHGGQAWRVHRHEAPVFRVFHGPDLVYLSPDSSNTLTRVRRTAASLSLCLAQAHPLPCCFTSSLAGCPCRHVAETF